MKLTLPKSNLAQLLKIAPNAGYFGRSDWNSLVVSIDREIDWVCLQNGADTPEHLNLQQIVVISKGRDISHELQSSATCTRSSSLPGDKRAPSDLLMGGGLDTDREAAARWEMRLKKPLHVDRFIIKNRSDVYGARSNSLHVIVGRESDLWLAHDPYNAGRYGWLFNLLATKPENSSTAGDFRPGLLKHARDAVIKAADVKTTKLWQFLQLIDQKETDELLKAANISLLAAVTARYHAAGFEIETRDLHQFSELLSDKRDVISYEEAFNQVLPEFSRDIVTVSRHFITSSKLLTQRELYCSLIREVHETAADYGSEVCLGYGTLLGCIRNGGFIPHDDDIDLIVRVPSSKGNGDASNSRARFLKRLASVGYQVEQFVGYEHHNLKKANLSVELFPAYEEGESVRLYMEAMKFREIPKSIMYPLRPSRLYDVDVNIPAQPEAFLAERYGSSWKRPDRFYEWRWELKGEDPPVVVSTALDEDLPGFDEGRYLELYPDVARAVQAGSFKSGASHFLKFGRSEGRAYK